MTVYKIELQSVVNDFGADPVTIYTQDPQLALEEWLAENHSPLESYRYSSHKVQTLDGEVVQGRLTSRTYPAMSIVFTMSEITPVDPTDHLDFRVRRRRS